MLEDNFIKKFSLVNNSILRRFILVFIDLFFIYLSIFSSFYLSDIDTYNNYNWIILFILISGIIIYIFTGQYKGLTKYIRSKELYRLSFRNILLIFILLIFAYVNDLSLPPIRTIFLLWLLLTAFVGGSRFLLRDFLNLVINKNKENVPKVFIYGAGSAGAQLAKALISSKSHKILGFIDDNNALWGRTINDIKINSVDAIRNKDKRCDNVLLAIPSLNKNSRRKILNKLQNKQISVLQIPSLEELSIGKVSIDNLRPIKTEDLLGRDPIKIDPNPLKKEFSGKVICITGAGGSIGSELCRQIVSFKPSVLLLLDISEHNLYKINQELISIVGKETELIPLLGDATKNMFLEKIFSQRLINYVFHAAAYKHVPMVEINPLQGIFNNVFSTRNICKCAIKYGVEKVILISTDKAVRPTNIMGASKRLAELVVQAFDQESKMNSNNVDQYPNKSLFSMVRFGNVLGSSGSVVPLFEKQIKNGGPVTITHKDIIRYFMTISEAAHLVLKTTEISKGGDVFLLDMGSPVKIFDLAEKMIKLSGFNIKNKKNPNGDIEIVTSGLRPGEKLFEELLIDAKAEKTIHPLIFKAKEKSVDPKLLSNILDELEFYLVKMDVKKSLEILSKLVPEWGR